METPTTLPLPQKRDLFLSNDVNAESMLKLTEKILDINEEDEMLTKVYAAHGMKYSRSPIKIYIDSYGGYVYQCFGLLSIMQASKTAIHTIATGAAMSCGFMILICGHKRFAYELATPMYHQISSAEYGKVRDFEDHLKESKRLQQVMVDLTLRKTRITKKQLDDNYHKKQDWYMSAKEALRYGVIDEIIK